MVSRDSRLHPASLALSITLCVSLRPWPVPRYALHTKRRFISARLSSNRFMVHAAGVNSRVPGQQHKAVRRNVLAGKPGQFFLEPLEAQRRRHQLRVLAKQAPDALPFVCAMD